MTAEIAVSGSRQCVNNCATKETLKVLIKLLVGDTTCVLNASRAELLDTQTRTHDSTKRLGMCQRHENQ